MAGKIGKTVYGTRRWKAVRAKALQLAGWRCSRCRSPGRLEVHHRHPVGGEDGYDRAFDLSNLKVLCRRCHFDEHRDDGLEVPGMAEWRDYAELS